MAVQHRRHRVTDYHWARSLEAANNLMGGEHVAEQLLAAVRQGGLNITMEQLCRHNDGPALWNRALDELMSRCEPKRGTLESMILWTGERFLENAHFVCACELFPDEQIAVGEAPPGSYHSRVFLCKQRLVFDFSGYWFHKQGEADAVCPQPNLSDLEYA